MKKILAGIIAFTMFAGMAYAVEAENTTVLGDINGDGEITSADALNILQAVTNITDLTDEQKNLADLNNDGNITSADALYVLQIVVGENEETSNTDTESVVTTQNNNNGGGGSAPEGVYVGVPDLPDDFYDDPSDMGNPID